jgi:glucose/arabinose dehydrogenase
LVEEFFMSRKFFIAAAVLLLAACSSTGGDPYGVARERGVMTAIAATQVYEKETAPALVAPPPDAVFEHPYNILLRWEWERPLRGDEVFDVRVWREGEPHYGVTWSPNSSFNASDWLRYQQPGDFYWSVAVITGSEGQVDREISSEAPARKFTVLSNRLPTPTAVPVADTIELPPGFVVKPYAEPPTNLSGVMTWGPDGELYIMTHGGDIYVARDLNGDRYAEDMKALFIDHDELLSYAIGIALYEGVIYISDSGRISTFTDGDGDGTLDTLTPIVTGLPSLRHPFHSNNQIEFGPDGKLYVGIGSNTDHGPLDGSDETKILRMNPDGSELEVFATGFRNPNDITFSPEGELFTIDNNPNEFGPDLRYLPGEEVNYVQFGKDYGFPRVFGTINLTDDPSEPPLTEFYSSVGVSGIVYYAADQFPEYYRGGLFVTQFGTAAPSPVARSLQNGRQVVFVKMEKTPDGRYVGDWETFAAFDETLIDFRPVDVTVGPDGALYVLEWFSSKVYRIEYVGESAQLAVLPTPTPTLPPTPAPPDLLAEGEALFLQGAQDAPACVTCHLLDGTASAIAPSLLGIRYWAEERSTQFGIEEYIYKSIVEPNLFVVPGYNASYMYLDYGKRYTIDQIEALVAYVLSLDPPPPTPTPTGMG